MPEVLDPTPTSDADDFFDWLSHASEDYWSRVQINPGVYGFQIQPSTTWRPGLPHDQIDAYESEIGFRFPPVLRAYLRHMNGTDLPTVNVYGCSGTRHTYGPGFYSYPDDLPQLRATVKWIYDEFGLTDKEVEDRQIPHIMPIILHRCLIVDRCAGNPVLSIYGQDVIPWAPSLKEFLLRETGAPEAPPMVSTDSGAAVPVSFWLATAR